MAKKSPAKQPSAGKTVEIVRRLAQPVTDQFGLLLWDVRFVKEGAEWFLRVFIDREEEPVSIDDCVNVSRKLSDLLDETDPIPQSYCLEVSSPGIGRELSRPEHFERFIGAPIEVRLYQARDGVKSFNGLLLQFGEDNILHLQISETEAVQFERKEISAVHLLDDPDEFEE